MRLNIVPSRHTFMLENGMYSTTMKGSIIINYTPKNEYDLVNKQFVDDYIKNIDLSRLTGYISKDLFPNYAGDFTKTNNEFIFKHTTKGKSGDAYMTVSKKGFVTASTRKMPANFIKSFGFERIVRTSFPAQVEGLGITNAVNLEGKGVVKGGLIYKEVSTRPDAPITPRKITTYLNPKETYEIGDIIIVKSDVDMSNTSFRKLNGAVLNSNTFPELAKYLGPSYGLNLSSKLTRGQAWKNAHNLTGTDQNKIEHPEYKIYDFPELNNLGGAAMFATKDKVFVCGGYRGDRRRPLSSVYKISLDVNGYPTKVERLADMPEPRVFSRAVTFCNYAHLIGGTDNPMEERSNSRILRCRINSNGDITGWEKGQYLPYEYSRCLPYVVGDRLYILGGVRHTGSELIDGVTVSKEEKIDIRSWALINLDGSLREPIKEDERDDKYMSSDCLGFPLWIDLAYTSYSKPGRLSRVAVFSNINNRSSVRNIEHHFNLSEVDEPSAPLAGVGSGTRTIYGLVGLRSQGLPPFDNGYSHIITYLRDINGNVVIGKGLANPILENNVSRSYHDCAVTNAGIFFLSGISNMNPLENRENGIKTKCVLVKTTKGTQNYMPWIELNRNPDTVTLPLVDDTVFNGETYSYYIKVE